MTLPLAMRNRHVVPPSPHNYLVNFANYWQVLIVVHIRKLGKVRHTQAYRGSLVTMVSNLSSSARSQPLNLLNFKRTWLGLPWSGSHCLSNHTILSIYDNYLVRISGICPVNDQWRLKNLGDLPLAVYGSQGLAMIFKFSPTVTGMGSRYGLLPGCLLNY